MTEGQKKEIKRLRESGAGYTAIAGKMGIPKETVRSFCRRNGLAGQAVQEGSEDRQAQEGSCRECGKPLQQTEGVKRRVFCSRECREKWWHSHPGEVRQRAVYSFTCTGCGKPFTAYGNSKRKYCSHECYIRNRFKGGDDGE